MPLKRNDQSFLEIIAANKGIIYKVANAYCKSEDNRKDLVQEIMIQLWLTFPKYDQAYKVTTWMYRIALNVSISFYRKEHRRVEFNQSLPEEIIYLKEDKSATEAQANIDMLHKFIKELKEIDRAVILLYLDERSHQESADILGLSITNISSKIARIRQQLKQKFTNVNTTAYGRE